MTPVRRHLCTADRNRESGNGKGSIGCSEYNVLGVFDVASGDRNKDGQMFGRFG